MKKIVSLLLLVMLLFSSLTGASAAEKWQLVRSADDHSVYVNLNSITRETYRHDISAQVQLVYANPDARGIKYKVANWLIQPRKHRVLLGKVTWVNTSNRIVSSYDHFNMSMEAITADSDSEAVLNASLNYLGRRK